MPEQTPFFDKTVLFSGGSMFNNTHLSVARFNLEWLSGSADSME